MALVIAAICLVVSVVMAVSGANKHRRYAELSADEIANYLTDPFLDAPELWRVHVRSLRTLQRATANAQNEGDDALKSITVSLYAFLSGLAIALVAVGTLILEMI